MGRNMERCVNHSGISHFAAELVENRVHKVAAILGRVVLEIVVRFGNYEHFIDAVVFTAYQPKDANQHPFLEVVVSKQLHET